MPPWQEMLSLIIPVYNNVDVLGKQLEAVISQSIDDDWEVIVADNGSTDGTQALADAWATAIDRVRRIDASRRRGPGAARNMGAEAARGDRLVFCDGDDIVQDGWLAALTAGLERADVVVGPFDMCSLNNRPPAELIDPWPRQFNFLPAGLGANMAVGRRAFEAVGGFDEDLLVGEDIDLCWRLQLRGYLLESTWDAVVAKRGRPTGGKLVFQSFRYGRSDAVLFRRFGHAGMPRRLRLTIRTWGWLVLNSRSLLHETERRQWLRVLFIQIGRVVGSFEQRVFYP